MKVLFVSNLPSPYRVDFFNEWGRRAELTVLFERRRAGDRDSHWQGDEARHFTPVYMDIRPLGADKSIGLQIVREIRNRAFDALFLTGYSSPSVMLAIAYCRLHRIPYFLESDGGLMKKDGAALKALKRFLLGGARLNFTTADSHIRYLNTLGIGGQRIVKYPFTSLLEKDMIDRVPTAEEKAALRSALGVGEKQMVLSVGRMVQGKGFEGLLGAADGLPAGAGLYIVGGRPPEEYGALIPSGVRQRVHFVDFMDKESLKRWYRAADLFVLPTLSDVWGLVVSEAMAQGLPVLTTDRCAAGLELVRDGVTGRIVSAGNAEALRGALRALLTGGELAGMGAEALRAIRPYTIENMAKAHQDALAAYLAGGKG